MPGEERAPRARSRLTEVGAERALHLLENGRMRLLGRLPRSSNFTLLCEIADDETEGLAVYKPVSGETPLWDFPPGTLAAREAAAFVLSEALGWPNVPPTVLRDGPEGPGSVQLFIDHDPERHYLTMAEESPSSFLSVAAFDVVANNADRKSGHCLVDDSGTVWCVDHGVCFHAEDKLRTVIWEFAGTPIPDGILGDLRRVADGAAEDALRALLAPEEVAAVAARADGVVERGVFPHPGAGRAFPWPPV